MFFIVRNKVWKVSFVSPQHHVLQTLFGDYTVGAADNETKTIYLSNELYGNFLWKVLCHELVHAFCFEYQCNLPVEMEEFMADFIAKYGKDIVVMTDNFFNQIKRDI